MSEELRNYIRLEYEALQDEVDAVLKKEEICWYDGIDNDYKSQWYEMFNSNWDYLVLNLMEKFDLSEEEIEECVRC